MCTKICLFFLFITVVSVFAQKLGDCPPPTAIGVCAVTCFEDEECKEELKCCGTACGGSVCTRPITARNPETLFEKPGSCPARPSGPWVCTSRCAFDGDCRGKQKCCKNRCGAMACTLPEY